MEEIKTKYKFTTKDLLANSMILALYVVLTYITYPISYMGIQFRVAEIMVLLVFFRKDYAIGLILGCAVANLPSGIGLIDVLFGTMATALACICIMFCKQALDSSIEFDENLGKFDFYDTDISMQAVAKYHIKLGVMVQKDLCHYSVGKSILTSNFLDTEEKFRAKWKLPVPVGSPLEKHIAARSAAAGAIVNDIIQ